MEEISGSRAGLKLGMHSKSITTVLRKTINSKPVAWCRKGIVGRGVFLDYLAYSEALGQSYELLENYTIPLSELKACARAQNLEFRPGDILIIRSGWTKGYATLDASGRQAWADRSPPRLGGIATTKEIAEWLWETGFSAVASDSTALESLPFSSTGEPGGLEKLSLHEVLLGGWGMPIGMSTHSYSYSNCL